MAFPQSSTVIDDFNRANGNLDDSAGSSIWDTIGYQGGASNWLVSSSTAVPGATGAQHLSLFDFPASFDAFVTIAAKPGAGNYLAWLFCVSNPGASFNAYGLLFETTGWTLYKYTSGSASSLATGVQAVIVGDRIGIRRIATTGEISLYHYTAGAWNPTPIVTTTDSSYVGALPMAWDAQGAWALDDLSGGAAVSEGGGGGGDPITFYVDADHPAASDSHTRVQAGDASTPLLTMQRTGLLAIPGDTIAVKWAADADPTNAFDTEVYAGISHNDGAGALPYGDNSGNARITLQGIAVGGKRPKALKSLCGSEIYNWDVKDFQFGYEPGSGNDNLTIQNLLASGDMRYYRCFWTGGMYFVQNNIGDMYFEDCEWRSPLSVFAGAGNRFLDGAGLKISTNAQEGNDFPGHWHFVRCDIHDCEGEDGIQVGTGAVTQANVDFLMEDCHFHDLLFSGGAHTDAIQILGGPSYIFKRCTWDRCTNAISATDFHNGLIRVENCKMNGAALTDPDVAGIAMQIQGTDNLEIVHTTSINNGFGLALGHGSRTPGITCRRILVNNVLEGVTQDSGVVLDSDSVDTHNTVFVLEGNYSVSGTNIIGVPEFGTSVDTDLELSNSPVVTLGINAATASEATAGTTLPTTDRLGRARVGIPDIGCHELQSGVTVTPQDRPPRVISRSPAVGAVGVSATASVQVVLYPRPGVAINPATVTTTTFYVVGPSGTHLPVTAVSLVGPDGSGRYTAMLDIDGDLMPWVVYSANMTQGVQDAAGSALAKVETWSFRAIGIDPAVSLSGSAGAWYVSSV